MIYTHNLTKKGQVTIPKEFRDKLGLDKIGKASFRVNNRGEVVLTRPKTLEEIHEGLGKPEGGRKDWTEREKIIIPQVMKSRKYRLYEKETRRR